MKIKEALKISEVVKLESWKGNKCIFVQKPTFVTMSSAQGLMRKALLAGKREKFAPLLTNEYYVYICGKEIVINYKLTKDELNSENWIGCQI